MKPDPSSRRPLPTILILVLILMLPINLPLLADEAAARTMHYHELLSGSLDPIAAVVDLVSSILDVAGSSYFLEHDADPSEPLLLACNRIDENGLSLLLAVDLNHVENARWSLAVWLAMLESQLSQADSCTTGFAILPPARTVGGARLEAGEIFWILPDPYQRLADLNPASVILLDLVPEVQELSLEAEARSRLSPLHVLTAVRSSLEEAGLAYRENAVKALYARAGLVDGSAGLGPWLELGAPAIRLHGHLDGSSRFLPAMVLQNKMMLQNKDAPEGEWPSGRDVNYLRYQLPSALISVADVTITRIILLLLGVFMASVALRPLFARRLTGGPGPGALPEALVAYLFSFIAVYLSWLLHGFAARLFGTGPLAVELAPALLTIGLLGRLGSTMLFFFALSGLSARWGLLPHAARGTASQASAMIAGILGMVVLFFNIQGSLLLFGTMILLSLAGINAAVAVLSFSALIVFLFPLVVNTIPVFLPGLITILNAQGRQLLLLAGFTAPLALWILTTLSPRNRLARGNRTAPYLVALAVLICFLDPWLRVRL